MKPLWKCPKCHRQFANRNQQHSCTDVTAADYLKGKDEELVRVYQAFEAAVRACGEVRVHAVRSRIAFITRMTFAGASIKKDHVEAAFILPYRSNNARFHRFLPSGPGGAHWFKLKSVRDVDAEVREWALEAYKCGLQEPQKRKLPKKIETAPVPALPKRRGPRRAGRIFLLRWNESEMSLFRITI